MRFYNYTISRRVQVLTLVGCVCEKPAVYGRWGEVHDWCKIQVNIRWTNLKELEWSFDADASVGSQEKAEMWDICLDGSDVFVELRVDEWRTWSVFSAITASQGVNSSLTSSSKWWLVAECHPWRSKTPKSPAGFQIYETITMCSWAQPMEIGIDLDNKIYIHLDFMIQSTWTDYHSPNKSKNPLPY